MRKIICPINFNTKAKAKQCFRELISVSTVCLCSFRILGSLRSISFHSLARHVFEPVYSASSQQSAGIESLPSWQAASHDSASPRASHKTLFTLICRQPGNPNIGSYSTLAISSCGFHPSIQKNARAHKNKIGTSPPPQTRNTPPP